MREELDLIRDWAVGTPGVSLQLISHCDLIRPVPALVLGEAFPPAGEAPIKGSA